MRLDRLATLGIFHPLSRLRGSRRTGTAVLMYHSISENADSARHPYFQTTTTPARFALHMQALARRGHRVIPLSQVRQEYDAVRADGETRVAITFDDGYSDFASAAFPVLATNGFPATVFLATDYVGQRPLLFNGRPCLTWPQVRELHTAGVEFGSHTLSHPQLHGVSTEQLRREIVQSKDAIEQRLGGPIHAFSYPYAFPEGDMAFCARLRELLRGCGYRYGVSTIIGTSSARDDPYFLPRIPVSLEDDEALLEAKIGGGYDWLHGVQLAAKRIKRAGATTHPHVRDAPRI